MLAAGCTDNGGAIHSVERIVNILSERVCYNVTHNQQLKTDPRTEISVAAHAARLRGEKVYIEHVLPHREFAQMVCCKIDEGLPDEGILQFIEDNYRLVLLTEDERRSSTGRTALTYRPIALPASRCGSREHCIRPSPPSRSAPRPLNRRPSSREDPRRRGRFGDVPDMTPEERKRRGDAADALFRELVRRVPEE